MWEAFSAVRFLGTCGGGFLLPLAAWRYSQRDYGATLMAATLLFWMALPLLALEGVALVFRWEEFRGYFAHPWSVPLGAWIWPAYAPTAVGLAYLLRRAARRGIAEAEDARFRELEESAEQVLRDG